MRPCFFPVFILLFADVAASAEPQFSYPTISPAAQKVRDDQRRLILEVELQAELKLLADAESSLRANATDELRAEVHRRTENVKALRRELDATAGNTLLQNPQKTMGAKRLPTNAPTRISKATATFWDPYNRELEASDSSTR